MKPIYSGHVSYNQGICPVAERMYEDELITLGIFQSPLIRKDLNDVIAAFQKVWEYRSELLWKSIVYWPPPYLQPENFYLEVKDSFVIGITLFSQI